MTSCPRCRTACAGDAYCSWCGLPLRAAAPSAAPSVRRSAVPPATPSQRPGTITAVRVLLGLSVAGFGGAVLLGAVGAVFASSVGSSIAGTAFDDGTSATLHGLGTLMGVLAVVAVVLGALDLWAIGAVGARRRSARVVVTLVEAVDMAIGFACIAVVGAEAVVPVLMSLPCGIALLVLLWVPESSRRWFDPRPDPAPAPRSPVDDEPRTEALALPSSYRSRPAPPPAAMRPR